MHTQARQTQELLQQQLLLGQRHTGNPSGSTGPGLRTHAHTHTLPRTHTQARQTQELLQQQQQLLLGQHHGPSGSHSGAAGSGLAGLQADKGPMGGAGKASYGSEGGQSGGSAEIPFSKPRPVDYSPYGLKVRV